MLNELHLNSNKTITEKGIKHMKLKKLSLGYNSIITDNAIHNMDLIELDLTQNDTITNKGTISWQYSFVNDTPSIYYPTDILASSNIISGFIVLSSI
jgi:hypothetical protein